MWNAGCQIGRSSFNILLFTREADTVDRVRPLGVCYPPPPRQVTFSLLSLVALNFQTHGEQMDLNNGRFLQNGQCGYALKPPFMCEPHTTFNPENVGGGVGHAPVLLSVQVRRRNARVASRVALQVSQIFSLRSIRFGRKRFSSFIGI